LKATDGVSDPAQADIAAGKLYNIWYDGSVFRMMGGAVTSVFSRTGSVIAQSGDYTTAQVAESGNLYFTNARAQSALSGMYQTPITGAPGAWPGAFAPSAHALLSSAHSDTTAASPVRGDGLFAIGSTPTWQRLAHPSATGGYFKWNGTDMAASAGAAAGTGSCTNQVVTAGNADASPSCSTVVAAMTDTSIAHTGADINTSHQVTATHLAAALPVNQGGTGAASTLTGLVRGSSSAMTAAELSGDATTSGSNAVTVAKVNGTSVPANSSADQVLGTTASATGSWISVPNCPSGALQYSTSTHTYTCGTGAPSASGGNPAMDGSAAAGSSANYARADHVHPTDTTRQASITGAPGAWPSSFAPAPHASTHQYGGSDPVATVTPGANAIPQAGSGGTLAAGWIPSALGSTTSVNGTPIPASAALLTTGTAVQSSQMPALSGDCTSAAGSTVLTCARSSATSRTYPFFWQGMVQGGATGFAVNLPIATAPALVNSGGTMPIAALEWPAGQSTYYAWWTWIMPAGYPANGPASYSVESRCNAAACDSTHANIVTLGFGCAGGAALDAPAIANASPVNVTNGALAAQTVTAGTLTPNSGGLPACAAGNRVWVRMIVDTNTNSLTGPFDLISAAFTVQGSM
jgi:hypothetical protein